MTEQPQVTRWRMESIECTEFKAFAKLQIPFNRRNMLIYGENGSGKSSIYEAIKLFVNSTTMDTDTVTEKFTQGDNSLVHLYPKTENSIQGDNSLVPLSPTERVSTNSSIKVTLSDSNNEIKEYTLSKDAHDTKDARYIKEARLASDFVTYRVLYNFYSDHKNGEVNLWQIFAEEILPFCVNSQNIDISSEIESLQQMDPQTEAEAFKRLQEEKRQALQARERDVDSDADGDDDDFSIDDFDGVDPYTEKLNRVNTALILVIADIKRQANEFYKKYFKDKRNINLDIGISGFELNAYTLIPPKLILKIETNGITQNPLTFLNEASLTQIALSIRFGASLMMLNHDSKSTRTASFKLLVIDDLLISLDLNNRMEVIDILLGETFADFQKIIMTHDKEFFNEVQRRIHPLHTQWEITEADHELPIGIKEKKTNLQIAEDYLHGFGKEFKALSQIQPDYNAAGLYMRQSAEELFNQYDKFTTKLDELAKSPTSNTNQPAPNTNQPAPNTNQPAPNTNQPAPNTNRPAPNTNRPNLNTVIKNAIKRTTIAIPSHLYINFLAKMTLEELHLVIPQHGDDIPLAQRDRIKTLRHELLTYLRNTPWRLARNLYVIQQLDFSRNRILNAAAHNDPTPQYKADFEETLQQLKMLTRIVNEPDITAPLMRFEIPNIQPIDLANPQADTISADSDKTTHTNATSKPNPQVSEPAPEPAHRGSHTTSTSTNEPAQPTMPDDIALRVETAIIHGLSQIVHWLFVAGRKTYTFLRPRVIAFIAYIKKRLPKKLSR